MKFKWLLKDDNPSLLIIALGWSCDESAVSHIGPAGWDVACVYDYREIKEVTQIELAGYEKLTLIGWSFGIWAAEHIFHNIKFNRTIAINGSPFPVNDQYGIAPRVMDVTIKGLKDNGMEKFIRRVYGDQYESHPERISKRPVDEQIEELEVLRREACKSHNSELFWDQAIISRRDLIFPLSTLSNFWGFGAVITEMPHYPFGDAKFIYDQIGL